MAEQEVEVIWRKAEGYRIINPNGVTGTMVDAGEGTQMVLRLTTNWTEITKETFKAEIGNDNESVRQIGSSAHTTINVKIEEAALVLSPDTAGSLAALLIDLFEYYPKNWREDIIESFNRIRKQDAKPS